MADLLQKTAGMVLQLPADEVSDDISIGQCAAWDSLQHFNLILALEQAFAVRFSSAVIPDLNSIARIRQELQKLKENSA